MVVPRERFSCAQESLESIYQHTQIPFKLVYLEFTDLHFYMLRWSNAWQMASLNRIRQKWNLAEDGYFQAKYKQQGWRRYGTIIYPLARRLTFGVGSNFLARAIAYFEHIFNRYLTDRHANQQRQLKETQPLGDSS